MKRSEKVLLSFAMIFVSLSLIYVIGMRFPKIFHARHEYKGYTYYSNILDFSFDEKSSAEYCFDSMMGYGPEFVYILDAFYDDGYEIFFDNKFAFAWFTGQPMTGNDYAACVTFNKARNKVSNGLFVNYRNSDFNKKIFFHELSHYVDCRMGNVSQSSEFKEIFNREYKTSTLKDDDYYKDIYEYFAEESAYYILEKSNEATGLPTIYGTHTDAPETFDYIEKIHKRMQEEVINAHG